MGRYHVVLVVAGLSVTIVLREQNKKPPTVVVSGKPANVGGWG